MVDMVAGEKQYVQPLRTLGLIDVPGEGQWATDGMFIVSSSHQIVAPILVQFGADGPGYFGLVRDEGTAKGYATQRAGDVKPETQAKVERWIAAGKSCQNQMHLAGKGPRLVRFWPGNKSPTSYDRNWLLVGPGVCECFLSEALLLFVTKHHPREYRYYWLGDDEPVAIRTIRGDRLAGLLMPTAPPDDATGAGEKGVDDE